jgi:tetratricopeptide (TPR) repeat protein
MLTRLALLAALAQDKIESPEDGFELPSKWWTVEPECPKELEPSRDYIRQGGGKIQGYVKNKDISIVLGTLRFVRADYKSLSTCGSRAVKFLGEPDETEGVQEARYDWIRLGGIPAVRYQVLVDEEEGSRRMIAYAIYSSERIYLAFASCPGKIDKAVERCEELLSGLKTKFDTVLRPPEPRSTASKSFRVPGARIGYSIPDLFEFNEAARGKVEAELFYSRSFIRVFSAAAGQDLQKTGDEARRNLLESVQEANSPTRRVGEGRTVELGGHKVFEFETEHAFPGTLSKGLYRVVQASAESALHILSVAPAGEFEYLQPAFDLFLRDLKVEEDRGTSLTAEGRAEFDRALKEADRLRKARRPRDIPPVWEAFIKNHPDYVFGYDGLARAYLGLGDYARALETFDKAAERAPEMGEAHRMRAVCLLELDRVEEAREAVVRALEFEPENPDLLEMRANVHVALGRFKEAHADVDRIEQFAGNLHALLLRAKLDILEGVERSAVERLKAAEREAEASEHWQEIADVYDDLEMNEEAARCLHKAVDLDLDNDSAILALARTLSNLKRYEDALTEVDRLIERQPANSGAIGIKARVLFDLGRQKEARELVDRAIEKNPQDAWLLVRRAWVLHTPSGEFERALEDLGKAAELSGRPEAVEGTRGQLLQMAGRYAEAAELFGRTLKKNQRMSLRSLSGWLHRDYDFLHLYWALRSQGKKEEAAEAARAQIKTRAGTAWSRLLVRCVSGEIGMEELAKFANTDLKRCEAHFWHGVRLVLEGRTDEAKAAMKSCVDLGVTHYIEHTLGKLYLEGRWPR